MKRRNLDVVHSGMVLLSDGKGRGNPALLTLTKDQLSIQVNKQNYEEISSLCGITQVDSSFDSTLRTVNVSKTKEGIGLSIKGGSDGTHHVPIVISKVLPNLAAAQTGQIFVGDSIVEINGTLLEGKTHEEVVQMLRQNSENHVTLTLKHDSQMAPLLRPSSSKQTVADSILDLNIFKSALKTPMVERNQGAVGREEDTDQWKLINRLPLPLAIVSRYLWGTDKIRTNAFEVRSVDGRSSGVIHCEDRKALEQWINYIEKHIFSLNKKSIRMSNKYLHPSEKISYIGWVEEKLSEAQFNDPKQKWEQRFLIFKGSDLCIFESPPLNSEELDKCVCLYKIYEIALKTAMKRRDRRENCFCVDTTQGAQHYFSVQSKTELQQFEMAFYNCTYKAINTIQTRTFACSYDGRPAGFVLDISQGISLYDIPTKRYIWQYRFNDLENSCDDGKMRLQFRFREEMLSPSGVSQKHSECIEIECDQVQAVVFTLHAFYVTKIMGADPEYLKSLPLA